MLSRTFANPSVVNFQIMEKTTILPTADTRNRQMLANVGRPLLKIPQVDGQTPDPYEEMLSTPNVSST